MLAGSQLCGRMDALGLMVNIVENISGMFTGFLLRSFRELILVIKTPVIGRGL